MSSITVTMNGKKVRITAGIDIPTLCEHPALAPCSACRMCVVEIQGQRNLQTAGTFPVSDGMDIQTESDRVVKAR